MGRGDQLRRPGLRARCASSSSPTPRYWIDEFHLDGLRLDATQQHLRRLRAEHILAEIGDGVRAGGRGAEPSCSSPRTSRRTRGWSAPRERGRLRARRALERRLPPQRHGGAHRPERGVLQRLLAARRRSSSPPRSTGYLYPGPALRLAEAARAARRRSDLAAGRVRHLHPEPRPGRQLGARGDAAASARRARRAAARSTALLLLRRARRCCSRARSSRPPRRSSTSPITTPSSREAVRKGRREFLTQFPQHRARRDRAPCSTTRRSADVRALQARLLPSARRNADVYALHRDLLALRRDDAGLRPAAPRGGVDGAVLGRQAFVLRYLRRRRRRPAAARQPRARPRSAARCRAAARAAAGSRLGRASGRSEDPPVRRRRARPTSMPEDGWRIPGECGGRAGPAPRRDRRAREPANHDDVRDDAPEDRSRPRSSAHRIADARQPIRSTREWLVTNGLGGYASGTVAGVVTRRYHGLLIAALPAPLGRT